MSQTKNLNLEKFAGGDYIDYADINQNYDRIDALGLDYIVDQGTSGNWWYRRWNSGRAECGVDSQTFSSSSMSNWGSLFISNTWSFGAYPFSFSSPPCVSINYLGDDGGSYGGFIHIRARNYASITTRSPNFSVVDAVKIDKGYVNPKFCIYVTGRYK